MYEYSMLSFPGLTCLFWSVVLACRCKKNYRSQNIFALNMLVLAVSFYVWNVYFMRLNDFHYFYKLDIIESFSTLSVYPLTYLYFRSLTDSRRFGWKDYLWFLPALVVGGSSAVLYGIMGEENAAGYVQNLVNYRTGIQGYAGLVYRLHFWITIYVYNIVVLVQIIYTLIYAFRALLGYRKRLQDFYSTLDGKFVKNDFIIFHCFIISCIFSLIAYCFGRPYWENVPLATLLLFVGWGGVLNYLGFQVASLRYAADDLAADIRLADLQEENEGYERSPLDAAGEPIGHEDLNARRRIDPGLILRFNSLIDNDSIYLQPELRLDDVARMMCTNRTYISRMLNEEYQCSFSDFINFRRIAHAKSLMRSSSTMTQEQVAQASGFLHASSFSRIFKQSTGMTFREWQRQNLNI